MIWNINKHTRADLIVETLIFLRRNKMKIHNSFTSGKKWEVGENSVQKYRGICWILATGQKLRVQNNFTCSHHKPFLTSCPTQSKTRTFWQVDPLENVKLVLLSSPYPFIIWTWQFRINYIQINIDQMGLNPTNHYSWVIITSTLEKSNQKL